MSPVVSYDDEVTAEQIKFAEELVKAEFETGDWVIVESETPVHANQGAGR